MQPSQYYSIKSSPCKANLCTYQSKLVVIKCFVKNQDVPEGVYVAILEVSYIDSNGIENMKFINQSIQLLR